MKISIGNSPSILAFSSTLISNPGLGKGAGTQLQHHTRPWCLLDSPAHRVKLALLLSLGDVLWLVLRPSQVPCLCAASQLIGEQPWPAGVPCPTHRKPVLWRSEYSPSWAPQQAPQLLTFSCPDLMFHHLDGQFWGILISRGQRLHFILCGPKMFQSL